MKPQAFAMTAPSIDNGPLVAIRGDTSGVVEISIPCSQLHDNGDLVTAPTGSMRGTCRMTLEAFGALVRAARNAGWSQ